MTLTIELAEKVEALYLENLKREFGDTLDIDRVAVEPAVDADGQDTFRITIVFNGNEDAVDPKKAIAVLTKIATPLEELGLPPVLIQSYVTKDEYPVLLEMRAEPPWGLDDV